MARVNLNKSLQDEYCSLYDSAEIDPGKVSQIDAVIDRILEKQSIYQRAAAAVGCPWYFVAAIHNMESGLRFDRHLHNGDPLSARTVQVPAGRPRDGEPPFDWHVSAADALALRRIDRVDNWSLAMLLYQLEAYNGWGYRLYHQHVKSPYLWSFSDHYRSGKYIADGTWSDTARSRQCGAAVLLKRLEQRGEIALASAPVATGRGPLLKYSAKKVAGGEELQRFLNTFPGIDLLVDGRPGARTSAAVKRVFGFYLTGDPANTGDR